MSGGPRLGIVGVTGTLGQDLLEVLDEANLGLGEIRVFAGERSLGATVEFAGEPLPVDSGEVELTGLDAVVLCTPAAASLELIRVALRAEVPCIDCSGALLASSEVPLVIADLGAHDGVSAAPLISAPSGATLVWGPVLSALQRRSGLQRVVGTVLHSASSAGRAGIEALSEQTLALMGQRELSDPALKDGPVAFGSLPHAAPREEEASKDGAARAEGELRMALQRLLGQDVAVASSSVFVPSFAGQGGTLWVETERPLSAEEAATVLAASPGIEVTDESDEADTRQRVGSEAIRIARLRTDPAAADPQRSLMFWVAADPVRLASQNALNLLRTRLSLT